MQLARIALVCQKNGEWGKTNWPRLVFTLSLLQKVAIWLRGKGDSLSIEIEEQMKLQAYSFKEIPNRAHIEQLPDFLDDRRRIQVFPRNISFW